MTQANVGAGQYENKWLVEIFEMNSFKGLFQESKSLKINDFLKETEDLPENNENWAGTLMPNIQILFIIEHTISKFLKAWLQGILNRI